MDRKRKILNRSLQTLLMLFTVMILMPGVPVYASSNPDASGKQRKLAEEYGTVYIAGSRDSLPLEGIHNGGFAGIMPQFYRKLSEMTGMTFAYLDSRTDRNELAASLQCEILSLITEDDAALLAKGLIPGPVCFAYDGMDYRIAYTERMPEELRGIVDDAFSRMSDGDRLRCAVEGAVQCCAAATPGWFRILFFAVIGLCVALMILLAVLWLHDRQRIQKALTVDAVTQLYNRRGFSERFDRLREQRRFPLFFLAYILMDCEKELVFSGKTALNLQMEAGAGALKECLRPDWFAARTDVFGYLLCFTAGPQFEASEVLEPILDAIEDRMNGEGARYYRAYAGVCRADETQGDLIKAIDETRIAAWKAREQEERILIGSRQLSRSAAEGYFHVREMLANVKMEDFRISILPMVKLPEKQVVGGQATLRWQHPARGLLLPDEFLPYIEKTDRIKELDLWVFDRVCAWSRQRRESGLSPMLITCAVSGISLNDPDFYNAMTEKMNQYGIRPGEIGIEVGCGIVRHNAQRAFENLDDLHHAGVTVILDKLGSDKTALGALVAFSVDMVKLHSGLLPKETRNGRGLRKRLYLLDNAINLCRRLEIRIICSGVENESHNTIVQELGCDLAVGDHYYRPMPCDEFDRYFQ